MLTLLANLIYTYIYIYIYRMLVHIFGGKELPSCRNYAVRRTTSDHGSKSDESVVECVNKSFYMDDLLKSVETQEKAVSIIKQFIELMQISEFNLTKFQSNMKEVMDYLPAQNISQLTVTFNIDGGNIQQTWWIHWNITDGNFCFSSKIIDSPSTKHEVLNSVSTTIRPCWSFDSFHLEDKATASINVEARNCLT